VVQLNEDEMRHVGEDPLVVAASALGQGCQTLVVTLGPLGAAYFTGRPVRTARIPIPGGVSAGGDPTGCGDAYRAGLLYGIVHGWDWPTIGRLGSVMGAIKIAHRGGQNHAPAREEIEARFKRAFGYSPWKE
jgi:adenosine kinase